MKNIRSWTLAALIAAFAVFYPGTVVAEPEVGQKWNVANYCVGVDEEFIRQFTDAVVRGGTTVYQNMVSRPGGPCYDTRAHNTEVIRVTLMKRLWAFDVPTGEKLVMWLAEDTNGVEGYVWLGPDWGEDPET